MKKLLFYCILLLIFACGNSNRSEFSENYNNEHIIENKLEWESIENDSDPSSGRLKVPGGWIVRSYMYSVTGGIHQIFIADSLHQWRIK